MLGLLPQRFKVIHRSTLNIGTVFSETLLHPLKSSAELAIGFAQRRFGINREIPRDIYQHKKQIADLSFQPQSKILGNDLASGTGHAVSFGSRAGSRKFPQMLAQFGYLFGK